MTESILSYAKSTRLMTAGALFLALAACGTDADSAEQASTGEPGIAVEQTQGATLLARATLSPTHRVEFWEDEGNELAVIEDYAPDLGEQSALQDFRGDSHAALYQKLLGEKAEPGVVTRLRTFDARPRRANTAVREQTAAGVSTEPAGAANSNTKSVSEDARWFLEQICQPRSRAIHPDMDLCWTQSLDVFQKEVRWGQTGWYLFQGSLFNAASSGTAEFVVTGTDPRKSKRITAAPRTVVRVNLTSDNGFVTVGRGTSFAIYYSFID